MAFCLQRRNLNTCWTSWTDNSLIIWNPSAISQKQAKQKQKYPQTMLCGWLMILRLNNNITVDFLTRDPQHKSWIEIPIPYCFDIAA